MFSPQKIRCHHPKCPKVLNNHCISKGSANKLNNLHEQAKLPSPTIFNVNNQDNVSLDNSEAQSTNNTLSATMDEKQKKLLLKIANSSVAVSSAVASSFDNDFGNVS